MAQLFQIEYDTDIGDYRKARGNKSDEGRRDISISAASLDHACVILMQELFRLRFQHNRKPMYFVAALISRRMCARC